MIDKPETLCSKNHHGCIPTPNIIHESCGFYEAQEKAEQSKPQKDDKTATCGKCLGHGVLRDGRDATGMEFIPCPDCNNDQNCIHGNTTLTGCDACDQLIKSKPKPRRIRGNISVPHVVSMMDHNIEHNENEYCVGYGCLPVTQPQEARSCICDGPSNGDPVGKKFCLKCRQPKPQPVHTIADHEAAYATLARRQGALMVSHQAYLDAQGNAFEQRAWMVLCAYIANGEVDAAELALRETEAMFAALKARKK
jgi:hypothetical protein